MLKGAIHRSYVRQAILHGSEAWRLKECEIENLWRTEISLVRAMCGVQLKDSKRTIDLMYVVALSETIDQLTIENSVHWNGHVLRKEDGYVLRRALYFEVIGQRKKGRKKT